MKEPNSFPQWTVLPDAQSVAAEAARMLLGAAQEAVADHGRFRLVLAGGRTPLLAYALLAAARADWGSWEIYFGDERCLPPDHPERNSRAAREAWLDRVSIPAGNIHPIPAELGPVAAAAAYSEVVERALPFDLVLLGMGEDGHTASLFPGRAEPRGRTVLAVDDAPKPPPQRVSLSSAALSEVDQVVILVTGEGKREALRRWRSGEALPVGGVRGRRATWALVDRAASG